MMPSSVRINGGDSAGQVDIKCVLQMIKAMVFLSVKELALAGSTQVVTSLSFAIFPSSD